MIRFSDLPTFLEVFLFLTSNFQRSGFGLSEKRFAFEKLLESGAMKSLNVVTLLITVNQGRKKRFMRNPPMNLITGDLRF